jgi:methylthioribose-1-phosphate isomerase
MQHGRVDIVLVGSDRTTSNGDVANKTGTYLKALAAYDNHIPFYAALPSSSIDWNLEDGVTSIPIEERSSDEVAYAEGWDGSQISKVRIIPEGSKTSNYGFDVTPARLVTGLITERGICKADRKNIAALFTDK